MLPLRIGRYDVSEELGRGSTSIVYKGVDPASGRVVALKTLQRSSADTDADADAILLRFRNEARTIGRLRHPGVVAVDEFGEDGVHSWIAMEYVDGHNLDDLLVQSPLLGAPRVLALMDELLDALGSVHREGICHRDLKPANIMVTSAGRVKLTDFGVARLRDLGLTRVSSFVGTPAFMAPEQFTGGALDHRADLFACGVLLYLLLSGRRPFSGAPAAVMHQILNEEPPRLSAASPAGVGRAFDDLVARALAKRPGDRFASADDMRDALRAASARLAEATSVTVVRTLVQGADTSLASRPQIPEPRAGEDRVVIARMPEPMPRVVMQEARVQPQLVDAGSLYAAEAAPPPAAGAAGLAGLVASAPALSDQQRAAVQRLLARQVGPLAGSIVRRADAAAGGSRAAFIVNVLVDVPAVQRPVLREALEALLLDQGL